MAYYAGKLAFVQIGVTQFSFDKWKISIKCGTPKITNFLSLGFQQLVAGIVSATVTCSGPYNVGGSPLVIGLTYTFVLGIAVGLTFTVPVLVNAIEPEDDVEDAARLTVTGESNGVFTPAIS